MNSFKFVLIFFIFVAILAWLIPASGWAGCSINITATNSGNKVIVFDAKRSKVANWESRPAIWKKVFNSKSRKSGKNKVRPGAKWGYVYKGTFKCWIHRKFKFVMRKGQCETAFEIKLDRRNNKRDMVNNLSLGDLDRYCR